MAVRLKSQAVRFAASPAGIGGVGGTEGSCAQATAARTERPPAIPIAVFLRIPSSQNGRHAELVSASIGTVPRDHERHRIWPLKRVQGDGDVIEMPSLSSASF